MRSAPPGCRLVPLRRPVGLYPVGDCRRLSPLRMVNPFWFTFYYRRARGRSRARSGLIS